MSNLLNKFQNIKVENIERINQEDKEFCEIHTKAYECTLNCYKDILLKLIKLYNEQITTLYDYKNERIESYNIYIDMYGDFGISKNIDSIIKLQRKYVSKICSYFSRKYNVTIDSTEIYNKYKFEEVPYEDREKKDKTINESLIKYTSFTYNDIINEIFEQLGGFTFEEKATNEIKEAMKKTCVFGYEHNNYSKVKGKKVIIDSFFYIDSFDKKWGKYTVSYSSDSDFNTLLTAISHYEQGTKNNTYKGVYQKITNGENEQCFTVHSLMCIKAESLKLFKNGKIEIIFLNNEYAMQFAKEYCGYVEKVA